MSSNRIKDLIPHVEKIHSREISLATYPYEHGSIIVEGFLKDQRFLPVFDITGEVKPAGVIHHFGIWMLVAPDPLTIEDAQAQMMTIPLKECNAVSESVNELVGLEVKSGFSRKVKAILGGRNGCTHLCHLATVMIQEIVQGFFVAKRQEKPEIPSCVDEIENKAFLIDSCRMWKHDGPKIKAIEAALKKR